MKICDPGDKVLYGGEECTVEEVAFWNEHDKVYVAYSMGDVYYELKGPQWKNVSPWIRYNEVTECSVPAPMDDFFDQDARSPELEELGYRILGWMDGLESRQDNDKLFEIITYLLSVQYDKEGGYGSSWCNKGEYRSIVPNIDRKYDRLSKIIDDEISGRRERLPKDTHLQIYMIEHIGESKIDAVADLTVYCMLYLTWLRKEHPGAFKVWIDRNVPQYARDKIPFVQNYYQQYTETGN